MHGIDDGLCEKTRVVDQEKNRFVVPSLENTTLTLRSVFTKGKDSTTEVNISTHTANLRLYCQFPSDSFHVGFGLHVQFFVTHDCVYKVIPSIARLEAMEKERIEALKQQEAERERVEQAQAEALEKTMQEVEEIAE